MYREETDLTTGVTYEFVHCDNCGDLITGRYVINTHSEKDYCKECWQEQQGCACDITEGCADNEIGIESGNCGDPCHIDGPVEWEKLLDSYEEIRIATLN